MPVTRSEAMPQPVAAASPGSFHVRIAWACAAVGVAGFTPSYWFPLLTGTSTVPAILHVHAAVFYGWLALFVLQPHLAATRRLTRHRELGVVGVSLATAMVFVGIAAAVNNMKIGEAAGFGEEARAFSVVPVTGILFFAALVAIALLNVRRPDVHRRLMLIATVSLLNAAVGRLFLLAIGAPLPTAAIAPPPIVITIVPGLLTDLLLVPALIHDKARLGYVHRTYWIGGAALLASQVLRPVIGNSEAWKAFAGWLMRLI
jgi:hypothetical protein